MPGGNLSYVKKLIFTALIVFALCFGAATAAQADVVINELMTDNGVFDQNGEAYDWIELFNDGNEAVDLSGYGLSDKKSEPLLWTFPAGTTLKAGGYILVYCCGEDENADRPRKKHLLRPI